VQFQKITYPTQGRLKQIPRLRGVSKAQFVKGKYDARLEFLEGLGFETKKPSFGPIWKFPGTTH